MTLSVHTHLAPRRDSRPAGRRRPPAAAAGAVIPFPSAQPAPALVRVEFTSPDGRAWQAIGGGDTLAEAVADARDSCPRHTTWEPVRWLDLYGD